MPRIELLPDSLIAKIAAGEVVERPASVVKELVENSLDAGATRIAVRIAGGGARSISVLDDGSGMSERDARLAFRRHATSKIRDLEGLCSVYTLGFRGEALASIAAVARVRLQTRRAEDPLGVELRLQGDTPLSVSPTSCAVGTRVEVAELFEWVPARRKFLKSPATESLHILRWMEEIALARSDVHFELERDDRPSLKLLRTRHLGERVRAVLPGRLGEQLLEVDTRAGPLRVSGYASPTNLLRSSAQDLHLFVNGRPVRERVLLSAVRAAYRDALPGGKHPVAVLFLELPPEEVDVNAHPSKIEVRFREPGAIHQAVREAIRSALGAPAARAGGAARVLPAFGATESGVGGDTSVPEPGETRAPGRAGERVAEARGAPWRTRIMRDGSASAAKPRTGELLAPALLHELREHRYLGQLFSTYLLLERKGALVVLDQHAAHERVLFEQLRERALTGERLERQALLFPAWLELSRSSAEALLGGRSLLERLGFELEEGAPTLEGGERLALRSVPVLLRTRAGESLDYAAMLEETAAGWIDPYRAARGDGARSREGIDAAVHHVLATAACHAAVRRGDPMPAPHVQALIRELDAQIEFANCPHGRPIAWTLEERDLARQFLRPVG